MASRIIGMLEAMYVSEGTRKRGTGNHRDGVCRRDTVNRRSG
jgi:hypothetical protein